MSGGTLLFLLRFAVLLFALAMVGCSSSGFTAADMVMGLIPPNDFHWTSPSATLDNSSQLRARLGPDSEELLKHNWRSSTFGQMASNQGMVSVAVHQLASKKDAAQVLAEHKYPEAASLKLGQEAYRWFDRAAAETIFFRRDGYFCQLTIDSQEGQPVLEPIAAELDKLLTHRQLLFW